jgi:hypothetical protein
MQQKEPIANFSKTLDTKALSQPIYENEALAILEFLRKWRNYILVNKLIIKTN